VFFNESGMQAATKRFLKEALLFLNAVVLVGLAGCDATEPETPLQLQSIEIIAPSDTVAFYFADGARIASGAWFRSANEAPVSVSVSVEADHESLVWDANTGTLLTIRPTMGLIRVTGSAEGHRDTTVSVLAAAFGECPLESEWDDYFPVENGTVWTFDYRDDRMSNQFRDEIRGQMTVTFDRVACERGTRTVRVNRRMDGTIRFDDGSGFGPERPIEWEFDPWRITQSPTGRLSFEDSTLFSVSGLPRYQSLSGRDVTYEDSLTVTLSPTPEQHRTTTFRAGMGVVGVLVSASGFQGSQSASAWTRQ